MIYVGIDPGLAGGIGVIRGDSDIKAMKYEPKTLIELLKQFADDSHVQFFVEHVHAMPKQGVTSTFNFGMGFGRILGILEAFNRDYILVKPQTWKRAMGVTADKQTSIRKSQELFPQVSLLPTPRCRVPSDGLAEALLIAEYGRRSTFVNNNKLKR